MVAISLSDREYISRVYEEHLYISKKTNFQLKLGKIQEKEFAKEDVKMANKPLRNEGLLLVANEN